MQNLLQNFKPIGLDALNSKAELMYRKDNKYVLTSSQLASFFEVAPEQFDVLEINGLRQFAYDSQYFDTDDFMTHREHNQGRRLRAKFRHRHYVDADLHFLELKLKGLRGQTEKHRIKIDFADLLVEQDGEEILHPEFMEFYKAKYRKYYNKDLAVTLKPSLLVGYKRITLVNKSSSERITIDNQIFYADKTQKQYLNNERWVVEVKSEKGRTPSDSWMRNHGLRPLKQCSKYNMGLNLVKLPQDNNRFSPVLRRCFL